MPVSKKFEFNTRRRENSQWAKDQTVMDVCLLEKFCITRLSVNYLFIDVTARHQLNKPINCFKSLKRKF